MGMFDWFLGSGNKTLPSEGVPAYPSAADIELYKRAGIGYGTPNAAYTEGKAANPLRGNMVDAPGIRKAILGYLSEKGDPRMQPENSFASATPTDAETRLYLAAQRNANRGAVAGLGFDARRFGVDAEKPTVELNQAGAYSPKNDFGISTQNIDGETQPGATLSHESTHRGLKLLRDDPENKKIIEKYMHPSVEEDYVRMLDLATAGSQPVNPMANGYTDAAHNFAKMSADDRAAAAKRLKDGTPLFVKPEDRLALLEALAADTIAKKRPGGPR